MLLIFTAPVTKRRHSTKILSKSMLLNAQDMARLSSRSSVRIQDLNKNSNPSCNSDFQNVEEEVKEEPSSL